MTSTPPLFGIVVAAASIVAAPRPAAALQPLDTFLRSASTHGPDNREARANAASQRAQETAALGRLLPGISLRGTYTRNQYESSVTLPAAGGPARSITIVPEDQLDGAATLAVPLVDLASHSRLRAARESTVAAGEQTAATALATEAAVTQDYFQLIADLGLVERPTRPRRS
jgi:outer membrane protein TolC